MRRAPSISIFLSGLLVCSGLLMAGPLAQAGATNISLGTATKGGGFQLYGEHLVTVINTADKAVKVEAVATKGSKQNLPFLEQGKLQVGLVEGNAAREALEGVGRDKTGLKVLSVMYPNPGMFVVRGDSSYKTFIDLKGKPIAFGTKASGLRILARDVLDGLGLKPDRDFKQIILDKAGDGPKLVLEGKAEALWGAGIGWPGFIEAAKGPKGARFIGPSADEIRQIRAKHPHLKPMSIPAGTYKGQKLQIDSVGLWSLVMIRPDVPDELAYKLARAIHRGEAMMARRLKQGAYTTAANTVAEVPPAQLHPGAVKYYREIRLMK